MQLICSKSTLPDELKKLTNILMNNSYPEHIVDRVIKDTLDRKDQPVDKTSTKNYITIHLPWLGRVSNGFPGIFQQLSIKVFWTHSWGLYSPPAKGSLDKQRMSFQQLQKFSVIYQFTCCFTPTCFGRRSQCLSARIEQHIPCKLLTLSSSCWR